MKATLLLSYLALYSGTASADCIVEGDMVFTEGQSTGHLGLECLNSTSYDATDRVCGPDGDIIETDAVYTCPTSDPEFDPNGIFASPYCVQCGPRGLGAALCLTSPDLPSECVGVDVDDGVDDGEESLPEATTTATTSIATTAAAETGSTTAAPFDQCEDESDVAIWTASGGENTTTGRPAQSDYCSREYDGGCYLDAECIAKCFVEMYGYTARCAACFGEIPICSVGIGCMDEW
jgi:hypothetical protein